MKAREGGTDGQPGNNKTKETTETNRNKQKNSLFTKRKKGRKKNNEWDWFYLDFMNEAISSI
jgi:hypothetical protein